jgi:hypothetical protein
LTIQTAAVFIYAGDTFRQSLDGSPDLIFSLGFTGGLAFAIAGLVRFADALDHLLLQLRKTYLQWMPGV